VNREMGITSAGRGSSLPQMPAYDLISTMSGKRNWYDSASSITLFVANAGKDL
jgi:hypothetical protein